MALHAELARRWGEAAAAGALRTDVGDTRRRRLAGAWGVVVQFNEAHRWQKRPADVALAAASAASARPARPAFDFTQAKAVEFLGGLALGGTRPALVELEGDSVDAFRGQAGDVVLVNVAPLMHDHFLVLLDWALVKPQRMEREFLAKGIRLTHAMNREDFALGFNSAGAWSSVNHFHFQGFFFPPVDGAIGANFPVTCQPRHELFRGGQTVSAGRLTHWPLISYAIGLLCDEGEDGGSLNDLVALSWGLIHVLQKLDIPHNILVTKAPNLVVWVFPRQPQREHQLKLSDYHGTKANEISIDIGPLRFAIAEASGLVVAGDDAVFQKLDEEGFSQILREEVAIGFEVAELVEKEWRDAVGA